MSRKKEPIKSVRAKGSAQKSRSKSTQPDFPDLASHRWNVGAVAWSPEGHIVILDPELRAKLERLGRGKRKRKEIVIGLPPNSGASVGKLSDRVSYQPYPLGDPPRKMRWVGPLELCVCEGRLMRLVKAFQGHLPQAKSGKLRAPGRER